MEAFGNFLKPVDGFGRLRTLFDHFELLRTVQKKLLNKTSVFVKTFFVNEICFWDKKIVKN